MIQAAGPNMLSYVMYMYVQQIQSRSVIVMLVNRLPALEQPEVSIAALNQDSNTHASRPHHG